MSETKILINNILVEFRDYLLEYDLIYLVSAISYGIGISLILRWFYINYGNAKTNRKIVADGFPLLIISVTLIIYLIKSSIALSLGLVGALSIVRFRAAIKEPEELIYLFFAIAIGLGLGAKQIPSVIVIFVITLVFLFIKHKTFETKLVDKKILISLKIKPDGSENNVLNDWNNIVMKTNQNADLHRFDQNNSEINATYLIDILNTDELNNLRVELLNYNSNTEITFLDNTRPLIVS